MWVSKLTSDEVETIDAKYQAANSNETAGLAEDFEAHCGDQPDSIADVPRMVTVASPSR
jgi:hypothetical protein